MATVILLLALFSQTSAAIFWTWYDSSTFSHGFLILPVCLYLIWRRRADIAAVTIAVEPRAVIAVVLASLGWWLGHATGTLVVQEFSLVAMAQAVILTMYGWPVFRALAFPLLYAYFAVPSGEALIPALRTVTASFSVALLRLTGIPVFADGNVISIPTGIFYVADACSGIRYLIASVALGILFAGLMYRSWWRRASFLALSIAVPIVANGIRAYGIILIAYLTSNELATGVDHVIYGGIFFALVTLIVLALGNAFREKDHASMAPPPLRTAGSANPFWQVAMAGVLALIPATAAKVYGDYVERPPAAQEIRIAAPEVGGTYRRVDGLQDPLDPRFAAADAEVHTAYEASGTRVYLHIGYYLRQRRGAEAVSSDHKLIGNHRWTLSATGSTSATIGDEGTSVRYVRLLSGNRERIVFYCYWVGGRLTGNPYLAKLLQAKAKLLGGPEAAAIIVADAGQGVGGDTAGRALREFLSQLDTLVPMLRRASPP